MKILFIFPRPKAYDSQSVREFPSGGTEKAVIFLGEAFQKLGHDVHTITTLDGVATMTEHNPDVVITQEAQYLELFPKAKKVWWTHHFSDQPVMIRSAAYGRCFADKIVTLSTCQRNDLLTRFKLDSVTIGHGVWLGEVAPVVEKDPYRLVYASTPFRGLERIPDLFRRIKEAEPRATIGIASSMSTYGDTEGDKQYKRIFDELRSIDGVELLGALNQSQLYAEFAKASIFFYPCTWAETYCLVMDEAIAHGCRPVVSALGALPERATATIDFVEPALTKPAFQLHQEPKDWMEVAKEWEGAVLQ